MDARPCEHEGCGEVTEYRVVITDDQGDCIVDEHRCPDHVVPLLRKHPDGNVPWSLWAPSTGVPHRHVKASEALRLMGRELM